MTRKHLSWLVSLVALGLVMGPEARALPSSAATLHLVVVTGLLRGDLDEQALRQTHDLAVEGVARKARNHGALSRVAYVGAQDPRAFLAVEAWSSLGALQQFYRDPLAQQAFSGLFAATPDFQVYRDSGWASYQSRWFHRPEVVVVVTGRLRNRPGDGSRVIHDGIVQQSGPVARRMGDLTHEAYLGLQDPTRFLAVDTWKDMQAMQRFYAQPAARQAFMTLLAGPPTVGVYVDRGWKSF